MAEVCERHQNFHCWSCAEAALQQAERERRATSGIAADAMRKLKQAQELGRQAWVCHGRAVRERDRAVGELVAEVGRGYEWDEKYDAAIGRAEAAELVAIAHKRHHASFHEGCDIEGPGLKEARDEQIESLKRDTAEGQRALAEERG